MSKFPQKIDYSKTPHFLFELGSLITTVFLVSFVISLITIGFSIISGSGIQIGLLAAGISGLLSLFGIGILYFIVNIEQ